MKNNTKKVAFVIFIMFAITIGHLVIYAVFDSTRTVANPFNPRMQVDDDTIRRGSILDRSGVVIAESYRTGDIYSRRYPFGRAFAHPIGYMAMGRAGLESIFNFEMQTLNFEISQRVNAILNNGELIGNSVVTTIDSRLQSLIHERMQGRRGAVVVMEPTTGRILAMVSTPNFDPNSVAADWSALIVDNENSPLLNRATQGLYPPGSVFKIVSALAILENVENSMDVTYVCIGTGEFAGDTISCMNNTAHGEVNLKRAFALSCNCYFAMMIEKIGIEKLNEVSERIGFNSAFGFELDFRNSSFQTEAVPGENLLAQTSIGQGRTLVTPLFMAMITSAVANDGVMMQPFIVDHVLTGHGGIRRQAAPTSLGQIFSAEHAAYLNEIMNEVVTRGTGRNTAVPGLEISGKTGTAENATGLSHGWFVAFADSDNPQIAVSIIIEQAGGTREALEISREIFAHHLANRS
ncbi:MAG: penicillin-binding transpeptidase domain-containing protein [Defluviitaleaceae bacterium]|nr:penicillin-binding transpeptidase domain-containing protein [Defluviitaleaceae bacterium]